MMLNLSGPRRIALLSLSILLLALGIYELMPGVRLKAKHEALLEWARGGPPGDFAKNFAGPDYHDQWGHRAEDVAPRVRAARLVHPGLTIEAAEPTVSRSGDSAVITQEIIIRTGDGETLANEFRFTWSKDGFWPWNWRLKSVEAPGFQYQ